MARFAGAPDRIKLRTPILLRSHYNFCGLGMGQTPALDQWVQGSSPNCSTNHSPHRRDFRGAAPNTPYWRLPPGQPGLWISRTVLYGRYGRSVSAPKNHFSWETETDLTRDWFESGHTAPRLTAVIRPSRLMGIGLLGFPRSAFDR